MARDAGLSREGLYKALSGERSPDFDTVLRVMVAPQERVRDLVLDAYKEHEAALAASA